MKGITGYNDRVGWTVHDIDRMTSVSEMPSVLWPLPMWPEVDVLIRFSIACRRVGVDDDSIITRQ